MSAPQIPNLLSRRGRDGLTASERRAARTTTSSAAAAAAAAAAASSSLESTQPQLSQQQRQDEAVRRTDDDANASRLSAVVVGLLRDPFAGYFGDLENAQRRMPVINRGTAVRTMAINKLVRGFLDTCSGKGLSSQIVSLGAGSDTRLFNLLADGASRLSYHEFDLPQNVDAKLACIDRSPSLRRLLTGSEQGRLIEGQLVDIPGSQSCRYQVKALDLRDLGTEQASAHPDRSVSLNGISPDTPTLIISECCLCYLTTRQVARIVGRFVSAEDGILEPSCPVGLVFYEPIRPDDSFGRTMTRNLQQRSIQMPTIKAFSSLNLQRARFKEYGLIDGAKATDIDRALSSWFTQSEKDLIESTDPLDEIEEWQMLAQHYCISWGWRGAAETWLAWQQMPE